jgi:hypothetical protein
LLDKEREGPVGPSLGNPLSRSYWFLSEEALETLRTIALPISCGYSQAEVREAVGLTSREMHRALEELRAEIAGDAEDPDSRGLVGIGETASETESVTLSVRCSVRCTGRSPDS